MARPRKVDQLASADDWACGEQVVHLDAVHAARRSLPGTPLLAGVTEVFAALSDPTRLRIVTALRARELCVCDLAATLGLSESAVSHQLRLLRRTGLVRPRRDGRLVYYALDDAHVAVLVDQALDHARHQLEEAV
jgi:DNA-binding transcriptional ArsR family regulator